MTRTNWLLVCAAVALAAIPLLAASPPRGEGAPFAGVDEQAQRVIEGLRPGYRPWATPLWEPPSGEIESLLFGIQAALGAAALAYCLGYYRGKRSARRQDAPHG